MQNSIIAARLVSLFLITLLSFSSQFSVAQVVPSSASKPVWLIVGDSLSAEYGLARGSGWVALLQKRLIEKKVNVTVQNASVSGETTAGGNSRISGLLAKHKPTVVVIELGGNDALRGLDLKATEANLAAMIKASEAINAKVVLIGMRLPPNYGRSYGEQFESMFKKFATGKVAIVPFFLEGFGEDLSYFQADRIHPLASAQPKMLDNVWPVLSKLAK